jgi:cob(I)alamin adenosyltransferase
MRLYTKTGDDGSTGLFGGGRVPKDHPRVVAYGEADGLNAVLGLAATACNGGELGLVLEELQHQAFRLGADLATPPGSPHEDKVRRISGEDVSVLERQIDAIDGANDELKCFVLPGGCELAARLHMARDAARRCERAMVTLLAAEPAGVSPAALQWINRCSDLLFAMARAANRLAGAPDVPWRGD